MDFIIFSGRGQLRSWRGELYLTTWLKTLKTSSGKNYTQCISSLTQAKIKHIHEYKGLLALQEDVEAFIHNIFDAVTAKIQRGRGVDIEIE